MHQSRVVVIAACLAVALIALAARPARAQELEEVIGAEKQLQRGAARSQQSVDRLSDETRRMLDEYRSATRRAQTLSVYNRQVEGLIAAQEEELASLSRQIEDVTGIEREILPLIAQMVRALEDFVELDVPFLLEERRERVVNLKRLMARPDVSASEKYRRVLEAWQVENDYGRAVEAYGGTLKLGDETRSVDFLKLGRVAFLYLTRDGREAGVWDPGSGAWVDASGYSSAIRDGLAMANKELAFDLLRLPVPAPRPVREDVSQ